MKKIFTLSILLVAFCTVAFAQSPVTKAEIEAQLKANGLSVPASKLDEVTNAANTVVSEKTAEIKKDATEVTTVKVEAIKETADKKVEAADKKVEAATETVAKKVEAVKETADKKVETVMKNEIQTEVDKGLKEGKTGKEALVEAVEKVTDDQTPLRPSSVYGHHLYRNKNISSITNGADVKASDNYELGIGDELSINVWGRAEFSGVFKIGDDGYIKIEKMPRLYLKGMKYGQAKQKITSTIGHQYNLKTSQIAISLNYSRIISVNIVGEVIEPRTYTLSALNTAVNALAAAEGPSDLGSVRRIQLQRAGKPNRILDLYKFLLNPMSSEEFFIENGDYIFVPPIGKVVEIQGAVKRPFKYELLPTENLKALLEWSGGTNSNAITSSVQIRRFENERTRILTISIAEIQKSGGDFQLEDGDILSIASIDGGNPVSTKEVVIQGAVEKPTRYNILMNEGLRVLIGRAGGLRANADKSNVQIRRYQNDQVKIINIDINKLEKDSIDFALERGDAVVIATIDGGTVDDSKAVVIRGAVVKPGSYKLLVNDGLRVLIGRAGGLSPNALKSNFQISRFENDQTKIIVLNYNDIEKNNTNVELKKGDVVIVPTIDGGFKEVSKSVTIRGAVERPGEYELLLNEGLRVLIGKAGGLSPNALKGNFQISRFENDQTKIIVVDFNELEKNNTNVDLKKGDIVIVPTIDGGFKEVSKLVTIRGAVERPGDYGLLLNEGLRVLIGKAGGLSPNALKSNFQISRLENDQTKIIVVNYNDLEKNNTNVDLKKGDVIIVPTIDGGFKEVSKSVTIRGAVERPGDYGLLLNEGLRVLIGKAGGLSPNALKGNFQISRFENDQTKIIVVNYNDLEKNNTNVELKKGDVVIVPTIDGGLKETSKLVTIRGAVEKPGDYELLLNESLRVLIGKAGGLSPNALKGNFQISRFENDQTKIIVVDFNDLEKNNTNVDLKKGDVIIVPTIDGGLKITSKSVTIRGAVDRPGKYELLLNEGLRVLIGKAGGILPNTYTGNFQVQRIEDNETKLYDVSLKDLDSSSQDFPLKKGDIITMNIIDPDYFTNFGEITGAVKLPGRYQIIVGKTRVSDFIKKAELREDANTPLVYLSRVQKDLSRLYYRINLDEVLKNPGSAENMVLQSKDELFILSRSILRESFAINVLGAVRSPGEQRYTVNTNLRDAIFRAGGLTFEADHKKIEISRVIIKQGEPVRTIVKIIEIQDTLYIKNEELANFKLQPFDQISVRRMPGFELQRYVTLNGEVRYPGTYAILSHKERLTDVIRRAGGLNQIAEPRDATLVRSQDNVGFVILDLKNALRHKFSYYNYLLKPGDIITIPKARELVSIEGAVDYPTIDLVKRISMTYRPNKGVQYYVQEYAGGLSKEKRGSYYHTRILYPNGAVRKTKRIFWVFNDYPKIQPGCVISVGVKPLDDKDSKDPNAPQTNKNNDDVIETTMKVFQFAVSALTVVLLASKI